ncbi:MAG TPA: ribonuclease HI family protein [Alphaproteobacteria bacterium]|nr:ribonuclease HI family protein [Alphaproteobacteria bacterium]
MLDGEYIINTDGSCYPNPGGVACWAFLVRSRSGGHVYAKYGCLGSGVDMTNNVAEYVAMLEALRFAAINFRKATIVTDSRLVVDHLNGQAKCSVSGLRPIYERCQKIIATASHLKIGWVPRERNREADHLTRKAQKLFEKSDGKVARLSLDAWYVEPPPSWER